ARQVADVGCPLDPRGQGPDQPRPGRQAQPTAAHRRGGDDRGPWPRAGAQSALTRPSPRAGQRSPPTLRTPVAAPRLGIGVGGVSGGSFATGTDLKQMSLAATGPGVATEATP